MADKEKTGFLCWRETRQAFREAGRLLVRHRVFFAAWFVLGAIAIGTTMPFDPAILSTVRQPEDSAAQGVARWLSTYGDFPWITILPVLLLAILGTILRAVRLQRLALAILLTAVVTGLFTHAVRSGTGRVRPDAGETDGWHGPSLEHRYNSFPSAHTSNAFATAATVAILVPPLSVPAMTTAAAVGWSRMQLNKHRLSDVLAGAWLGTTVAIVLAAPMAVRGAGKKR